MIRVCSLLAHYSFLEIAYIVGNLTLQLAGTPSFFAHACKLLCACVSLVCAAMVRPTAARPFFKCQISCLYIRLEHGYSTPSKTGISNDIGNIVPAPSIKVIKTILGGSGNLSREYT